TILRSTDSRRARNSASVITARRRLLLRPSLRRCRLASRRVDPFSAVTSSFALDPSCWPLPFPPLPLPPLRPPRPPLRRRRRREDPWDSPSPPLWSCWSPSWSLLSSLWPEPCDCWDLLLPWERPPDCSPESSSDSEPES